MSINKILITILLFICGYSLANDSDSLHYVQNSLIVNVKNYTMEDGLPSLIVEEGIQDNRGFLWFPTKYGLAYYDGNEFKTLNSEKSGLEIRRVFHIAEDTKGKIWLKPLFSSQKIEIFDPKTLEVQSIEKVYPSIKNIKDSKVYYFADNNRFFLLTLSGQLFQINENNEFNLIHTAENVDRLVTSRYLRFGKNGFWFNYDEITIRYFSYDGEVKDIYKGDNLNKPILIGVDDDENLLFTVMPDIDFTDEINYNY